MGFAISWDQVRGKLSQSASWTLHAVFSGGVGFLAGRTINMCDRWLHPVKNALGKPPIVNPLHGAMCGVTFALVDRVAHLVLKRYLPEHIIDKPITHAARVIVSVSLAAVISSTVLPVSLSMATVLLTTNVLATTLLVSIADYYTKLVYKGGAIPKDAIKQPEAPVRSDPDSNREKKDEPVKLKPRPVLVRA